MTVQNYYAILGLKKEATPIEIITAYIKLAGTFHQNSNDDDDFLSETLKNINEAYQTLSDVEKRKNYDLSLCDDANDANDSNDSNDENATSNENENATPIYSLQVYDQVKSYSKIKLLMAVYFEKERVLKSKEVQFYLAEHSAKPTNFTFSKAMCMVLVLIGSFWFLKPSFESKNTNENYQWTTTKKPKVFVQPNNNAAIIGEVENYNLITEGEQKVTSLK